jgi:chemotaxis protein CheX
MNDQEIQVFITGIRRYFESLRKDLRVVIEPPFLKNEEKPFLEYTGIIGISGKTRGAVCFTANGVMLENILRFLNEAPINGELIRDLVGEIANTLSGNAREEFGRDFLISVPVVSTGRDVRFEFPQDGCRNYVIPIIWQTEKAYLLVCLT